MLNREQIIKQIEANIYYYNSHADPYIKDGKPLFPLHASPADHALTSVEVLKEILVQLNEYDEVFDVRDDKFKNLLGKFNEKSN